MRAFPDNAREFGKEVAAFASTNEGLILIGVDDSGTLVGVEGLDTPLERDQLLQRIEGICHGPLKPSLTPSVLFAEEDGRTVVVVEVPRGREPVYYLHHVPYVRHLTESRPASPEEVVARVAEWLETREAEDPRIRFFAELGQELSSVLMLADQFEERHRSGGGQEAVDLFEIWAGNARRLATSAQATKEVLAGDLEGLADSLDAVAHHRMTLGRESWTRLSEKVQEAHDQATSLQAMVRDVIPAKALRASGLAHLEELRLQMESLSRRADVMVEAGRLREFAGEVGTVGRRIAGLTYWGLDREEDGWVARVRSLGAELSLAPLLRFSGAGREVRYLIERCGTAAAQLGALKAELLKSGDGDAR